MFPCPFLHNLKLIIYLTEEITLNLQAVHNPLTMTRYNKSTSFVGSEVNDYQMGQSLVSI
jgi:hypothetical protein